MWLLLEDVLLLLLVLMFDDVLLYNDNNKGNIVGYNIWYGVINGGSMVVVVMCVEVVMELK